MAPPSVPTPHPAPYGAPKQGVACIFFQKGFCLKGHLWCTKTRSCMYLHHILLLSHTDHQVQSIINLHNLGQLTRSPRLLRCPFRTRSLHHRKPRKSLLNLRVNNHHFPPEMVVVMVIIMVIIKENGLWKVLLEDKATSGKQGFVQDLKNVIHVQMEVQF